MVFIRLSEKTVNNKKTIEFANFMPFDKVHGLYETGEETQQELIEKFTSDTSLFVNSYPEFEVIPEKGYEILYDITSKTFEPKYYVIENINPLTPEQRISDLEKQNADLTFLLIEKGVI